MFLERHLHQTIKKAADSFPAVIITGPRQSGKTRLLQEKWAETHRFFSLEDPDTRRLTSSDPRLFFSQYKPPFILDEIQYKPDILPYIKSMIDEERSQCGQWLLTGSQQFTLMKGVSESLAGRCAILNLLPLSLAEIQARAKTLVQYLRVDALKDIGDLENQNIPTVYANQDLGSWLLRGSYPELYEKPQMDRKLWFASYVQSYLERDVRNLTQVGDLGDFEKFLKLLAARTGQILHLQEVTREVGVSLPTGKRWLSILETSFVIYLLRPYYKNFGKRLIKSPKIYFLDAGLAAFLAGLHSAEHLLASPMAGHLFETAVVSEIIKGYYNEGAIPPIYFWRSQDGLEVDLLIEDNLQLIPLEIKLSAAMSDDHIKGLKKWREITGSSVKQALLICNIARIQKINTLVTAYPWPLI